MGRVNTTRASRARSATVEEMREDAARYLSMGQRHRLDIEVSGHPVSVNEYKRRFRVERAGRISASGRYVPGGWRVQTEYTPEAVAWMDAVKRACAQALREAGRANAPQPLADWPTPVLLFVQWHHTQADLSNLLKATEDALVQALGLDDREYRYRWIDKDTKGDRGCSITMLSGVVPREGECATPAKRSRSASQPRNTQQRQGTGKTERPPHASEEVEM